MKTINSIKYLLLPLVFAVSCEIGEQVDPNSPSINAVLDNADPAQLNNLVSGTLSQMRTDLQVYYDNTGIVGREHYRFSGSDPRFVSDLLGQGGGDLDNNAFYTTRDYRARYRAVKNANILIDAATNSTIISEEERNGYLGFAKTILAHELLLILNAQDEGGIRIDTQDPDNLGPFVTKNEALSFIRDQLNEARDHLDGTGEAFLLPLSTGFTGFDDPESFTKFNRALAARVAAYRESFEEVLTLLTDSFLDLDGDLTAGIYYAFSLGSGDQTNPVFIAPNATGDVRVVRPEWVEEAEPGDTRLSKAALRSVGTITQAGLSSDYDVVVYQSLTDPIPIIRNEELILLYAEAQIQEGNNSQGITAINIVRNAANLANYSGATNQEALIDEVLNQRRYSLFFEGHRWIDMRRYGKLNELPLDREGDKVHERFPRPFNELGRQGG